MLLLLKLSFVFCAERSRDELEEEWNKIAPQLADAMAEDSHSDLSEPATLEEDETPEEYENNIIVKWLLVTSAFTQSVLSAQTQ